MDDIARTIERKIADGKLIGFGTLKTDSAGEPAVIVQTIQKQGQLSGTKTGMSR